MSISLGACRTGMCLSRYRDPAHLEGHDAERRQPGCGLDISGVLEAPVECLNRERRRDTEHETEREPDDQVLARVRGGRLCRKACGLEHLDLVGRRRGLLQLLQDVRERNQKCIRDRLSLARVGVADVDGDEGIDAIG